MLTNKKLRFFILCKFLENFEMFRKFFLKFLFMLQLLKMPYALKRDLPKGHKDLKHVGQKAVQAIEGLVNILFLSFYSNYALPQGTFLANSLKVISVPPAI